MAMLMLFISHSSADRVVVEPLVDLIRSALPLSADDIRCTSVDGYRLPAGAPTDDAIRREVDSAKSFIGIISPASLRSMYVAFELGARWGAGKHLIPLLAPGIQARQLASPLSGINSLRLDEAAQLHQLIRDLAEQLGLQVPSAAAYQKHVDALLQVVNSLEVCGASEHSQEALPDKAKAQPALKGIEFSALQAVAQLGQASIDQVAERLNVSVDKAAYYLEELCHTHKLVSKFYNLGPGAMTQYYLSHDGRGYLIERNVIN